MTPTEKTFNSLDAALNNQCKAEWASKGPTNSVNYLDLKIWLQDQNILTKTYQKQLNLFLASQKTWSTLQDY